MDQQYDDLGFYLEKEEPFPRTTMDVIAKLLMWNPRDQEPRIAPPTIIPFEAAPPEAGPPQPEPVRRPFSSRNVGGGFDATINQEGYREAHRQNTIRARREIDRELAESRQQASNLSRTGSEASVSTVRPRTAGASRGGTPKAGTPKAGNLGLPGTAVPR
jgi:hypothetical protein